MTYPAHGDLNYDGPLKTYIDQADAAIQADATQAALDAAAAVEGLEERPPRIAGGLTASAAELRYYNVKDYEGVGDGIADDYQAIQDTIDACFAAGGGIVGIPQGTWNTSDSVVNKPGVWILGSGRTATVIRPHSFPHQFTLIKNYRATQPSGANDTNMGVSDLTLDGMSTGVTDDGSMGYGIELYGATRVSLERLHLRDIPLSGIEISGNYAGVAVNGVDAATPPNAYTTDVTCRDITGNHIGWQEPFLVGVDSTDWGDAGFGIIARTASRRVTMDNCYITECEVGCFSVGQMDSQRGTVDPATQGSMAHCANIDISNCIADQTTASTLGAISPTFRVAFAFQVTLSDCKAIGNTDSVGFEIRSAGNAPDPSPNDRINLTNCQSIGNKFGFNVSKDQAHDVNRRVVLTGCTAQDSTLKGFLVTVPNVTMSGCQSINSAGQGFHVQFVAGYPTTLIETVISGCQSIGNGSYGIHIEGVERVNATGCIVTSNTGDGIFLEDSSSCTITGNTIADNGDYGVIETGTSDLNMVSGNNADNHAVANYSPISVTSKWGDQIGDVRTAIKPSDTTKNNDNTIAPDPHLTLELLPNSRYLVKLVGVVDGSNTADIKWNFTIPAGATGYQQPDGLAVATTGTTGSMNEAASLWTATPAIATAGVGTKTMFTPQGILITGATGGTFTFNWAQSTADATDTTLFAGSTLSVVRI